MYSFKNLFVISLFIFTQNVKCLEREMTINIDPGKEDCFFENVVAGETIDVEFQVIDGGHGSLEIIFHLADPTGRILQSDYKKSENNHRTEAAMNGDYKFCFDNTFSAYNSKTVFFEMIIERDDDWDTNNQHLQNLPEEVYEVTVDEITDTVQKVRTNLKSIKHLQDIIKSTEARDRNIAEENYFKVNTFSWVQICVMMLVGLTQVVMVRSLFDEKSRVHNVWKKFQADR